MEENIKSIWNDFRLTLLKYIKSKVSDEYAAEDILQEVFIKIYKNADQLSNPAGLKTWLYRITYNTIVDYYRKNNDRYVQLEEIGHNAVSGEREANMNAEIANCLKFVLARLPERYREPLELFEISEMKHREIAEKLDITLSGSKMRIQRAKEQLRSALNECCEFRFDSYGNIIEYKRKKKNARKLVADLQAYDE